MMGWKKFIYLKFKKNASEKGRVKKEHSKILDKVEYFIIYVTLT
jgi:hypothetical protein